MTANITGSAWSGTLTDVVRVIPTGADVDVDSDRNNGINNPDRNAYEEGLETTPNETGKLVAANDDDRDVDGIPDYADGFNLFSDDEAEGNSDDNTPPTTAQNGQFVKVKLDVGSKIDLTKATFQFTYDASDPAQVTRIGTGTANSPYIYTPADGKLRLWTKDGTAQRNKDDIEAGGDFIRSLADANTYTPDNWAKIGITAANRSTTLYVEGIDVNDVRGDLKLAFKIDLDGDLDGTQFSTGDVVKFSVADVDVMIGADTAIDDSRRDDWVGADPSTTAGDEHAIYNYLKIRGPQGLEQQLTTDVKTVTGGGTITLKAYNLDGTPGADGPFTRTLTYDGSTDNLAPFLIRGGRESAVLDDVLVKANFMGQVFGAETISVIKFNYEQEVGSEPIFPQASIGMVDGNYILNPAVRRNARQVFAFDVGDKATTGAEQHNAFKRAGTTPALNHASGGFALSKKFDAETIEVTWGRQITGPTAGSVFATLATDGSTPGSQLSFAPVGINGTITNSNLRIMDIATAGTGVDGNNYNYYLGHPTEKLAEIGGLETHYAAKVTVPTKADLVYNLNMNVMSPVGASLTAADISRLVMEASSIWEQVGVTFNWNNIITYVAPGAPTEVDLPNDDVDTLTAVTTKSRANGLDIFIVNSIGIGGGQFLSGAAAYENQVQVLPPASVGDQETGALISRRKTSPTSALEEISAMARSMAHEIGHLIINSSSHDAKSWNLMRDGNAGSTNNADLSLTGDTVGSRDRISILPGGSGGYNNDESW